MVRIQTGSHLREKGAITFEIAPFLVPRAGIEPALPKEQDFESSASTSSATGALRPRPKELQRYNTFFKKRRQVTFLE